MLSRLLIHFLSHLPLYFLPCYLTLFYFLSCLLTLLSLYFLSHLLMLPLSFLFLLLTLPYSLSPLCWCPSTSCPTC